MVYIRTNDSGDVTVATKAIPRDTSGWAALDCEMPDRPKLNGDERARLVLHAGVLEWRIESTQYTYNDYDNAMEDYIHQVAVDRGYTRREPSSYDNDPYPRFAQDAKDFKAFRSQVMLYALPILNEYLATGNAPTLAEFKAGFPKMVWTYKEEDQTSVKIEEHYEAEAPNV